MTTQTDAFQAYQDGDLAPTSALRALWSDLKETESELAPLEAQRQQLRERFMTAAMLGHAPGSQTEEYIDVTPAMLRPWVERWAGLVLGESGTRKLSSGVL